RRRSPRGGPASRTAVVTARLISEGAEEISLLGAFVFCGVVSAGRGRPRDSSQSVIGGLRVLRDFCCPREQTGKARTAKTPRTSNRTLPPAEAERIVRLIVLRRFLHCSQLSFGVL